jgi:LmbE family N-acetylglucosaminyl deacetylase
MAINRKEFLAALLALFVRRKPAVGVYRIARERGGVADQVVITNGEGGYRYSALAESFYGVALTDERDGRARLPAIRKQEVLRAGQILGIRKHYFLDQRDSGFSNDPARASTGNWDHARIAATLTGLMKREQYDFVFTLLPTGETHAHHRAATSIAIEAAGRLEEDQRPAVLGAEAGRKQDGVPRFNGAAPAFQFDRTMSSASGYWPQSAPPPPLHA